jgi:hypothetical protein
VRWIVVAVWAVALVGNIVDAVLRTLYAEMEDSMNSTINNIVKMASGAALSRRWVW